MKLKITIVFILSFCSFIHAQNLMKSTYNLEGFPEGMDKQKEFINKAISNILIYNFIYGGPGNSQFDLKSEKEFKLNLPLKTPIWLTFPDTKLNSESASHTVHYTYDFKYHDYYDDAAITDSIFSLASLFDLAVKYYDYDEYLLIKNVLQNYNPSINYKEKRPVFFDNLAKILTNTDIDFNTLISEEEQESLTSSEIEELMLDEILEETDYEFEDIVLKVFERFVLDPKDNDKTKQNFIRLFNDENSIQTIEQSVLQPHITVTLPKGGLLHIPEEIALIENEYDTNLVPVSLINIILDFKNKELIISFESKSSNHIRIKKYEYENTISRNKEIVSRKIRLRITDSNYKLECIEHNPYISKSEKPHVVLLK